MQNTLGLAMLLIGVGMADAGDARWDDLASRLGTGPALVVVVCDDGPAAVEMMSELIQRTAWKVLVRGAGEFDAVRSWAAQHRLLGTRVQVVEDPGTSLWLAGDMADAVWVLPGATPPPDAEIARVLRPGGWRWVAGTLAVQPAATEVDEWRHPYHGPDNNVVSRDRQARLPGELRFQTRPLFAAMPNQTLFAGGRIFFFTGHIAFHEREEKSLNQLTVLNAYNGLQLWSRPLDPNCVVHNFTKLATAREVVYAEGATLRVLDAATGAERGAYQVPNTAAATGDTDWKWIVQEGDTLWAALGPPDGRVAPHRRRQTMGHWPWDVANQQYRVIIENFGVARRLVAFRYPEMTPQWTSVEPEPFDVRGLCLEGGRIFELAPGKYLAARDRATGELLWRRTVDNGGEPLLAIGQALKRQGWGLGWATFCCARASAGVVCVAGPPFKKSIGIDLADGQLLWTVDAESPHPFFLDDQLYLMPRVAMPTSVCRTLDPRTGAVREQYDLGVIGSCTRLTVTPNQFFYRPGGGEGRTVYFDVARKQLADYEGVVRPGCFDGVVPANGRLYWMPLACDCWQVHGTFCMAPRVPLQSAATPADTASWGTPQATSPAEPGDWPAFRADASGSACVAAPVPRAVRELWRRRLTTDNPTPPICVQQHVYLSGGDGIVRALARTSGDIVWQTPTRAPLTLPPAYWCGRVLAGSGDGRLYCIDSTDGQVLGQLELAPEKRLVNIMDRLRSAWPVGGGVVVDAQGVAYAAAGGTAADGTVLAAVDAGSGAMRWRQTYTPDRREPKLSFGVQANLLLDGGKLFVNGGAPVGIVALDAATGRAPEIAARLEAGSEMFLEPDGRPFCSGPEMYTDEAARTTIFKRHQGRAYFAAGDRHVALVDGRLFCAATLPPLDRIVTLMNQDPRNGGKFAGDTVPRDVRQVPLDPPLLWASDSADIRGLAVGRDGLVVLHQASVEGLSLGGQSLWQVPLPAPPVRWGLALTGSVCVVTLADGHVVCLAAAP